MEQTQHMTATSLQLPEVSAMGATSISQKLPPSIMQTNSDPLKSVLHAGSLGIVVSQVINRIITNPTVAIKSRAIWCYRNNFA